MNFNMNEIEKSLTKLLNMLRTIEHDSKKFMLMLLIDDRTNKAKGKGLAKAKPKCKSEPQA